VDSFYEVRVFPHHAYDYAEADVSRNSTAIIFLGSWAASQPFGLKHVESSRVRGLLALAQAERTHVVAR
jgi:hypothetical protein